jgi:hypothetical protein
MHACAGQNVATLPGTNTTIATFDVNVNVSSQYYIDNGAGSLPFAYNGLTVLLTTQSVAVRQGIPFKVEAVIAGM